MSGRIGISLVSLPSFSLLKYNENPSLVNVIHIFFFFYPSSKIFILLRSMFSLLILSLFLILLKCNCIFFLNLTNKSVFQQTKFYSSLLNHCMTHSVLKW